MSRTSWVPWVLTVWIVIWSWLPFLRNASGSSGGGSGRWFGVWTCWAFSSASCQHVGSISTFEKLALAVGGVQADWMFSGWAIWVWHRFGVYRGDYGTGSSATFRSLAVGALSAGSGILFPCWYHSFWWGGPFFFTDPAPVTGDSPLFSSIIENTPQVKLAHVCFVLEADSTYVDPWVDVFPFNSVKKGLKKMFSIESLGFQGRQEVSSYDRDQVQLFQKSITLRDGKYHIDLPWHVDKLA